MKERVIVFIDGSNFYHRLLDVLGHSRIDDYRLFFEKLVQNRDLVRIIYYIGKIHPKTGSTKKSGKKVLN